MSKYGFQQNVQRFKCASCKKVFNGGERLINEIIWEEYIHGKQTYLQLATKYNCSVKTIQRRIDAIKAHRATTFPGVVNLLMDTTYFGRQLGVMVFKDSISGQILLKQYVKAETNKLYFSGVEEIVRRGIKVQSVICDGRKGLLSRPEKSLHSCTYNFFKVY